MVRYYKKKNKKTIRNNKKNKKNNKKTFKKNKNNKKNNRTFKKLICAPNRKQFINKSLKNKSCYNDSELFILKKYWNNNYPNNLITTNNPKEIWFFLKNNMKKNCNNELCWLNNTEFDNVDIKKKLIKKIFRPFSPKTWNIEPYEWLSNRDIIPVMKQYERAKKNFVFLGPSPIDFDSKIDNFEGKCVYDDLCNFDLKKYFNSKPRKNKIGIIFNLDPHYKGGSHWVALFINLIEDYIFYFDSNGDKIHKNIEILKNRIIKQGYEINKNIKYYENKVEHQLKDGQCGMYSLYFIIELLQERKSPKDFEKRIPDELMKDYRKKYFNKL